MHTYKSGNRYEGEWKFGKKNGHGTFWIKSGKYYIRKYRGSWKDNQYGVSLINSPPPQDHLRLRKQTAFFTRLLVSLTLLIGCTELGCREADVSMDSEESGIMGSGRKASDTGWAHKPTVIGMLKERYITSTTATG